MRVSKARLFSAWLVVAMAILSAGSSAWAQGYALSAVALPGETAPGTGGETYWTFSDVTQGRQAMISGDVAFSARLSPSNTVGLFVDSGGTDRAVALVGQAAPGTGGGTYGAIYPPANASDSIVFRASVSGGSATSGVFLDSGGIHSVVALRGVPAPGTGAGTYNSFQSATINASGDVTFGAGVTGGLTSGGLFKVSGGTHTAIVLVGDIAPVPGSPAFTSFGAPYIADNGDVAFIGNWSGGRGIFAASGGTIRAAALDGDSAPGTGGGTYSSPGGNDMGISGSGTVVLYAGVTGGSTTEGIFLDSGAVDSAAALSGDPAPGGGTYSDFASGIPSVGASGDVAFRAPNNLYTVSGSGTHRLVASPGDVAPGTGGGTFSWIGANYMSVDESGGVAFRASVTGGSVNVGIFRAELVTPAPALGPFAATLLAALLGALGIQRLRTTAAG